MNEIKYKYLNKEDEVQQVYRLMAIPEIYQWTGVPLFPPMIRESAKKKQIIIAKDGDKVVGFIQSNMNKEKFSVIHYRVVHPDYQGNGIASRLTKLVPPAYGEMQVGKRKDSELISKVRNVSRRYRDSHISTQWQEAHLQNSGLQIKITF